jgi:hypothetical protein
MGKKNKRKVPSNSEEKGTETQWTTTSTKSIDDCRYDNENKSSKKKKSNNPEKKTTEHINNNERSHHTSINNNKETKNDIDEIDELFAIKKETQKTIRKQEEDDEKKREEQRKLFRKNNNTSSSLSSTFNAKSIELSQDRNDVQKLNKGEWANDGLGGVFDRDGYTGRKEDGSGYKIYKAHLFNKKGFGMSKDCPFDCDCCYI